LYQVLHNNNEYESYNTNIGLARKIYNLEHFADRGGVNFSILCKGLLWAAPLELFSR